MLPPLFFFFEKIKTEASCCCFRYCCYASSSVIRRCLLTGQRKSQFVSFLVLSNRQNSRSNRRPNKLATIISDSDYEFYHHRSNIIIIIHETPPIDRLCKLSRRSLTYYYEINPKETKHIHPSRRQSTSKLRCDRETNRFAGFSLSLYYHTSHHHSIIHYHILARISNFRSNLAKTRYLFFSVRRT